MGLPVVAQLDNMLYTSLLPWGYQLWHNWTVCCIPLCSHGVTSCGTTGQYVIYLSAPMGLPIVAQLDSMLYTSLLPWGYQLWHNWTVCCIPLCSHGVTSCGTTGQYVVYLSAPMGLPIVARLDSMLCMSDCVRFKSLLI